MLARIDPEELESLLMGYGYKPYFIEGDDPETLHQQMAATLIIDRHILITSSEAEQADGVIKNGAVEAVIGDLSSMRQLKK